MSLIPPFEIGLWNAWIFMMLFLVLPQLSLNLAYKRVLKRWDVDVPRKRSEKRAGRILPVATLVSILYSFVLPLQLGTTWFYAGLSVCVLALVVHTMIPVSNAATPPNEPFTKGPYRYSRHPHYLTQFLIFIGTAVACTSWTLLLCAVAFMILVRILVISEERFCLQKYGEVYREYMNKTPRWIGVSKPEKN